MGNTFLNIKPTWNQTLLKGKLSGGVNPTLSNGDRIEAENGGAFVDLRHNNTDGITSLSDVAYINNNTNRVGIGVLPTSHDLEVKGGGLQGVVKFGTGIRDYYFNMNNLGQSHVFANGSDGGYSIGPQASFSRLGNAYLSVHGNTATTGVLSVGGASIVGNAINAPSNYRLQLGTTRLWDDTVRNATTLKSRNGEFIHLGINGINKIQSLRKVGNMSIIESIGTATTPTTLMTEAELGLVSKYWNGAINEKRASIKSSTDVSGVSKLKIGIEGLDNLVINEDYTFETRAYESDGTTLGDFVSFRIVKVSGAGAGSDYAFKVDYVS